ncbi:hypothetical protein ACFLYR_02755 [Chloroflexota bacterium]
MGSNPIFRSIMPETNFGVGWGVVVGMSLRNELQSRFTGQIAELMLLGIVLNGDISSMLSGKPSIQYEKLSRKV